jgi:hypothetical protein
MAAKEGITWSVHAHVDKWSADQVAYVRSKTGVLHPKQDLILATLQGSPPEDGVADSDGNLLTTNGLGRLTALLTGTLTGLTSTLTALGVGSTATAATQADTALGANTVAETGTVGCRYQVVDSAPTQQTTSVTNDTVRCICTYPAASPGANFAWQEWGIAAISSGTITASATLASIGTTPILINHKIASLGTKASSAAWAFTVNVQFS